MSLIVVLVIYFYYICIMSNKVLNILKEKTLNLFNDEWYDDVSICINETLHQETNKGFVYIIYSKKNKLYKIGISSKLQDRLNSIKRSVGEIIVVSLLKSIDFKTIEKDIHDELKCYRDFGEWFDLSSVESISRLNDIKEKYNFKNINYIFNSQIDFEKDSISNSLYIDIPQDILSYFDGFLFQEGLLINKNVFYKRSNLCNIYSQRKISSFLEKYLTLNDVKYTNMRRNDARFIKIL